METPAATPNEAHSDLLHRLHEIDVTGDVVLAEHPEVAAIHDRLQRELAVAATSLMTGFRWKAEKERYVEVYSLYKQLLAAVAINLANHTYETQGDTGEAKRVVSEYLAGSKRGVVEQDYAMRLQTSRVERGKQWLAHHRKTQLAGQLTASAVTTSALFGASDHFSNLFEESPARATGVAGVTFFALNALTRSLLRTGPTKAGAALSRQFGATLETYRLASQQVESEDDGVLPEHYANKHLVVPFAALKSYMLDYELDVENGEPNFEGMITDALDISERSMYETYNIDPDTDEQTFFTRTKKRLNIA